MLNLRQRAWNRKQGELNQRQGELNRKQGVQNRKQRAWILIVEQESWEQVLILMVLNRIEGQLNHWEGMSRKEECLMALNQMRFVELRIS